MLSQSMKFNILAGIAGVTIVIASVAAIGAPIIVAVLTSYKTTTSTTISTITTSYATTSSTTAPPSNLCVNTTTSGTFNSSQFIYSPTHQVYAAGMLNNQFGVYNAYGYGNVTSTSIWTASQSSTPAGDYFVAQTDRNLVVYTSGGSAIWATGTNNGGSGAPFCLKMLDSGNLVWIDNTNTTIWQSNSSG